MIAGRARESENDVATQEIEVEVRPDQKGFRISWHHIYVRVQNLTDDFIDKLPGLKRLVDEHRRPRR